MRIKLVTNWETINYFKEKLYYLLFKNRHHNSGIIRTVQQEIEKMNTMDLLSTLWIIGNLKIKANKNGKTNYNHNSQNSNGWRIDRRNKHKNIPSRSSQKPRSPGKTATNKTSTLPHSNRRKYGKSNHNLKTAHAYSVENELQDKNHLPASNLEQG